jgi:hypothetical protein
MAVAEAWHTSDFQDIIRSTGGNLDDRGSRNLVNDKEQTRCTQQKQHKCYGQKGAPYRWG